MKRNDIHAAIKYLQKKGLGFNAPKRFMSVWLGVF